MIISEKHNYIYLACPKTGTTSIEKFLLEQDPSALQNKIIIDGKLLRFKGHATAKTIQSKLQGDFKKYQIIGFIRHPYSRMVSSYFFFKNGHPLTKGNPLNYTKSLSKFMVALLNLFKVYLSRVIPFKLWAILFPYKSNKEFFVDDKNQIIVQNIGLFERLSEDLEQILKNMNLKFEISKLKKINKSKHDVTSNYFKNRFFKKLINLKVRDDLRFYNKIKYTNEAKNIR